MVYFTSSCKQLEWGKKGGEGVAHRKSTSFFFPNVLRTQKNSPNILDVDLHVILRWHRQNFPMCGYDRSS